MTPVKRNKKLELKKQPCEISQQQQHMHMICHDMSHFFCLLLEPK